MRMKRWLQCLGVVSSKWYYYHPLLRKPGKYSLSRGVIYTNQRAYSEISGGEVALSGPPGVTPVVEVSSRSKRQHRRQGEGTG